MYTVSTWEKILLQNVAVSKSNVLEIKTAYKLCDTFGCLLHASD